MKKKKKELGGAHGKLNAQNRQTDRPVTELAVEEPSCCYQEQSEAKKFYKKSGSRFSSGSGFGVWCWLEQK